MPSNSEYAQRQFNAEKAEKAERERLLNEIRALRHKVQALEEKVSSLVRELALSRTNGEKKRGFS